LKQGHHNAGGRQKQDDVLVSACFDFAGHSVSDPLQAGIIAQARALRNPPIRLEPGFVDQPAIRPMSARAERRAMLALVTVFALLVQALIPTLASATPLASDGVMICTEHGLQAATDGLAPDAPPAGHTCQHCVCPALITPPSPIATMQAVAYVVAVRSVADTPRGVRPLARAPPRPPGQGPPPTQA
jgi:hypothetical protein